MPSISESDVNSFEGHSSPLPLSLNNPPLPLNHYFSPFVSSLFLTRLVTMWWKILSGSFLKRDSRKNGQKSTLRIWNSECNTSLGLNENKSFLILKQAWKKYFRENADLEISCYFAQYLHGPTSLTLEMWAWVLSCARYSFDFIMPWFPKMEVSCVYCLFYILYE